MSYMQARQCQSQVGIQEEVVSVEAFFDPGTKNHRMIDATMKPIIIGGKSQIPNCDNQQDAYLGSSAQSCNTPDLTMLRPG